MSIYKNLQPHVHVLKLTGGTGDGKTEIATVFASKEARTVLLRGVGRTNSTLKDALYALRCASIRVVCLG